MHKVVRLVCPGWGEREIQGTRYTRYGGQETRVKQGGLSGSQRPPKVRQQEPVGGGGLLQGAQPPGSMLFPGCSGAVQLAEPEEPADADKTMTRVSGNKESHHS